MLIKIQMMNRKIPIKEHCHSQKLYGIFPMAICEGKLPYNIFHIYHIHTKQTLITPPSKILGLQEEAREKIKQAKGASVFV